MTTRQAAAARNPTEGNPSDSARSENVTGLQGCWRQTAESALATPDSSPHTPTLDTHLNVAEYHVQYAVRERDQTMSGPESGLLGPDGEPIQASARPSKRSPSAWRTPAIVVAAATAVIGIVGAAFSYLQGNRDTELATASSDADLVVTYWVGPPSRFLELCRADPQVYGPSACSNSILDERLLNARIIPDTDDPTSDFPPSSFTGTCISVWCTDGFQWGGGTTLWLIVENVGQHSARDISLAYSSHSMSASEVYFQDFLDRFPSGSSTENLRLGDLTPDEIVLIPLGHGFVDGLPTEGIDTTMIPLGEFRSPTQIAYDGVTPGRSSEVRRPSISIGDFKTPWIIFGG